MCQRVRPALQQDIVDGRPINAERQSLAQFPLFGGLDVAAEDQRHPFRGSRTLDPPAFRDRVTRLIGCDLYNVRFAQVERDRLIAEAFAHFDLDGVHKRAAAPVIVSCRRVSIACPDPSD